MAKISHIGIVVKSIEEALPAFTEGLGLHVESIRDVPELKLRIAFLPLENGEIELLEPLDQASGQAKFLAARGEGIHHICLGVDDIRASIGQASGAGIRMIDEAPRWGAIGEIAFMHPKSMHGVLVELLQAGSEHD